MNDEALDHTPIGGQKKVTMNIFPTSTLPCVRRGLNFTASKPRQPPGRHLLSLSSPTCPYSYCGVVVSAAGTDKLIRTIEPTAYH